MSNNENNITPEKDDKKLTKEPTTEDTKNVDQEYYRDASTKKQKWQNKSAWKRGLAMVGYGFVSGLVRMAITLIAVFQFFTFLFTEQPNKPLIKLGKSLNNYMYQINNFLTFNAEEYPFPFADWPECSVEIKKSEE